MNIKIEDINDTRKKLSVSVSPEEVEKEHGTLIKEFSKMARLPGFRPGKAPSRMVEKQFSKEIQEELNKKIVSEAYRYGLKESKLDPINVIDISGGTIRRGEENDLTFVVDVRPDFQLPDYKGLPLTKKAETVTEKDIGDAIERLREQRADFREAQRPAARGDFVKLNYSGSCDGRPIAELIPGKPIFGAQNSTWEEVGADNSPIPGLTTALDGMSVGDKKTIDARFPDDFPEEALRGRKAQYELEIFEVREKVYPELNEEFLKGLRVESQEQLREQVKADIERRKRSESRADLRNQAIEKVASQVEFPLPESVLESETQSILRNFIEQNVRRGIDQEQFEAQKEDLYDSARRAAAQRVKARLILARIADLDKIEATNEDLQQFVMMEAFRTREKPDKIVRDLRKNRERMQGIQQEIILDKALDFLVEKATITEAQT